MKKQHSLTLLFCVSGVMLLGGVLSVAQSQPGMDWNVISGGGGTSNRGRVEISDTVGQPLIGLAQLGAVSIGSGYWYGAASSLVIPTPTPTPTVTPSLTVTPVYNLFNPLIRK